MGPGWDAGRILDSVKVTPEAKSNILEVVGKADSAEEANRLADTFTQAALRARAEAFQRQVAATLERLRARQKALGSTSPATSADLEARIGELEGISEGGDPTLSLARAANLPTSPAGAPPIVVVILSIIVGLTIGIAAAIVLEMLNRRVRDEKEAMELYELPVLSRIPTLPRRAGERAPDGTAGVMAPATYEAFRTVLAQLTAQHRNGPRSIMVTSASTGDGKTSSAVSLAIAFATARHRILLLDMDVRKPGVARRLGIKAEPLASLVPADGSRNGFSHLFRQMPGIPTLSVLATSGPDATASAGVGRGQVPPAMTEARNILQVEMLHERIPLLLAEARAVADFIVVDTPPLGEFSDALRIASEVDDVIVVTRPRHTNRRSFEVMRDLLERTGHVPTGMIVVGDS
jgi:Mrp family chromosome partitioning ATPase